MNFAPSGVLKVQNLKEHFSSWTSFQLEVRQVSIGLPCVMQSGCYRYFCVHAMLRPWLQVLFLLWTEILTWIYFCNVYFEFLSLLYYGWNNEFVDLKCIPLNPHCCITLTPSLLYTIDPLTAVYASAAWTDCVLAMINIIWYEFEFYKWRHFNMLVIIRSFCDMQHVYQCLENLFSSSSSDMYY